MCMMRAGPQASIVSQLRRSADLKSPLVLAMIAALGVGSRSYAWPNRERKRDDPSNFPASLIRRPRVSSCSTLARYRGLSPHDRAALRWSRKIDPGARGGHARGEADTPRRPEESG